MQPGDLPSKPVAPTDAPWVFKGWYTDAALTHPADFTATLNSNQTFFARWDPELASTGGTINYTALWGAVVILSDPGESPTVPTVPTVAGKN